MKILVHVCCAPDAVYFLQRLRQDFPQSEITAFFYDPNIHPYEEYKLRLVETKRVCQSLGIKLVEGEYDVENWLRAVKGLEDEPERGKRCEVCFDYRLSRSLEYAKQVGASYYTTTLLMSPKKDFKVLSEVGSNLAKNFGVEFLALDYRKGGGTQEMFRLSKNMEIYHQDYCGCIYGLFKQKKEKAMWDLVSFLGRRRPASKEERLFIKELRLFAEDLGLKCKEWEFSFINWKLLHASLKVGESSIPFLVQPFSRAIKGTLKADVEEVIENTLYYNKGGLKVVLVEELKDMPLEEVSPMADPTFLVSMEQKEKLLNNRISAELQAEICWDTSSVLLIGDENSELLIGFPADTLQDGSGVSLEQVCRFIESKLMEIKEKRLSIALLGAQSFAKAGSKFLKERVGREPNMLVDYRSQNALIPSK
ncbi:epoxyqueuosine reductase QueH [Thermocrinis sp.]|uniref:epoxyqueuosine reductase QueH n=1 Tax=Thermocrinis sp. TaxID=2024383 RepID=UPI002FDD97C2